MNEHLKLNVALLKKRVPNLTAASKAVGLRPATVSNLCTGKIPVGRAEVKTIVALASLSGCTLDELIIRGSGMEMIETGIKALDLFAPLVQGGNVGFVARVQMGQLVLLAELTHRLKNQDYSIMMLEPRVETPDLEETKKMSDFVTSSIDAVLQKIKEVEIREKVILIADRSTIETGEYFTLRDKIDNAGFPSITTLLYDSSGDSVDEDNPYGPLETLWPFDIELSSRHLYPAINSVLSTSTLIEDALLNNQHMNVQRNARKLLRRYKEVRVLSNSIGVENLSERDLAIYNRGIRLEAFLTQPFYVAESFTKIKGEYVSLDETIHGVQRILDGALDQVEPMELTYIGKLKKK
ncbi:F-type H+-transporting ATPase subunit beta [Bacillus pakistanensis]|uniref:F-type H+-transporting ATPase subunit beta n=1 Tax=Rossellomorea pakistanensis TaxID=992288 RepID=A0ABS2N8A2_9BACI|nr:hypothetical protein [Bacillus pakistanensis]MBM7584049.1 F-type H+-transporting ATPase subunit beta [Bacillus pakistanensis]